MAKTENSAKSGLASIVLGIAMFCYVSPLIPAKHWYYNIRPAKEAIAARERTAALITAARNGDISRMTELLSEGADVNRADALGVTPLISAASGLQHGAANLLLSHDANRSLRTLQGFSAFDFANNQSDHELAEVLDPNFKQPVGGPR
jgi:ankyrin repeat protein